MIPSEVRNAVLRRARPEDLAAVLSLLEQSALPLTGVPECFARFVVAEDGGVIVGAAGLEVCGADGLLRSLTVRADRRGSGLGGALADAVLSQAATEGLGAVYLLTETAESFFRRRGFERIGREDASEAVKASAEFSEVCPATAVVMVREVRSTDRARAPAGGGGARG